MDLEKWKEKHMEARKYTHFDPKVSLNQVWDYISDSKKIERHGFYPFIHYTQVHFKYNKQSKQRESKQREINYSAHIDRYIYQYYAFRLNELYNKYVIKENYNDLIIAYRNNMPKMNNIHFAKRAFDFIKESNDCFVFIGDFTDFFDRLDHSYLKKMLCTLLEVELLPPDYYAVFENITKYSTWELKDLLNLNGLKDTRKDIRDFNRLRVALPKDKFKEVKSTYICNRKNCNSGIPQGSAISSVLSNIYMMNFDKEISNYVEGLNGLYMRYSDDFIIILPKIDYKVFYTSYEYIKKKIKETTELKLVDKKTKIFSYDNGQVCRLENTGSNILYKNSSINYLGFAFDGKSISIRDKTISKYYNRMYRKLKTIVKNKGRTKNGNIVTGRNLYLKYSVKGAFNDDGNFITYVRRAEKVFYNEQAISRVSKRHMGKIRRQLKKLK